MGFLQFSFAIRVEQYTVVWSGRVKLFLVYSSTTQIEDNHFQALETINQRQIEAVVGSPPLMVFPGSFGLYFPVKNEQWTFHLIWLHLVGFAVSQIIKGVWARLDNSETWIKWFVLLYRSIVQLTILPSISFTHLMYGTPRLVLSTLCKSLDQPSTIRSTVCNSVFCCSIVFSIPFKSSIFFRNACWLLKIFFTGMRFCSSLLSPSLSPLSEELEFFVSAEVL